MEAESSKLEHNISKKADEEDPDNLDINEEIKSAEVRQPP